MVNLNIMTIENQEIIELISILLEKFIEIFLQEDPKKHLS